MNFLPSATDIFYDVFFFCERVFSKLTVQMSEIVLFSPDVISIDERVGPGEIRGGSRVELAIWWGKKCINYCKSRGFIDKHEDRRRVRFDRFFLLLVSHMHIVLTNFFLGK